ncbi:hypothetical protein W59_20768 [Rhodococcus opacus RKJ300 = JCM 13270]|uniref:Uncharacterized protein n=1 Tax=Rhodococcus opacus RKJ300 = JCM 13270 TaxID=1165867 RepID=I0WNS7_RHOOP|nr:hypothetical protein W59_20768 [Rhodococcus opacus RKJ300 = JCM 13270]
MFASTVIDSDFFQQLCGTGEIVDAGHGATEVLEAGWVLVESVELRCGGSQAGQATGKVTSPNRKDRASEVISPAFSRTSRATSKPKTASYRALERPESDG